MIGIKDIYTLRQTIELLYETDPAKPALEKEEEEEEDNTAEKDSSEIWRNLEERENVELRDLGL